MTKTERTHRRSPDPEKGSLDWQPEQNTDDSSRQAVEVVSAFRFHMFDVAAEVSRRNLLGRLWTAMPRSRIWELDGRRIQSQPASAAIAWLGGRAPRRWNWTRRNANRLSIQLFDLWVSGLLPSDAPIVHSLSGCATRAVQLAHRRGAKIICDRGSWHIMAQKRVLSVESERWGFPLRMDPWSMERELQDYETADAIVVPSTRARESFIEEGFPGKQVHVLPYGVDLSTFRPLPNRTHSPPRIVCVGAVSLRKGHHYLLKAFRDLHRPEAELVFAGPVDADFERRFSRLLESATVLGPLPRASVADLLRGGGIFALASVEEGLSLALLQAMASGLPIVATSATGASDIVEHGRSGLLVEAGDADALARSLDLLLSDEELRLRMGRCAVQAAQHRATWSRYGDSVETLYRTIGIP